jgi:hypothetical protein
MSDWNGLCGMIRPPPASSRQSAAPAKSTCLTGSVMTLEVTEWP